MIQKLVNVQAEMLGGGRTGVLTLTVNVQPCPWFHETHYPTASLLGARALPALLADSMIPFRQLGPI